MPSSVHATVETFLILLLVIFAIALLVQRIHLPYTVVLVVVGLVGFPAGFREVALTPDLILEVFLPALLFEGAYNVAVRRLWREIVPITLLAVPGVILGTFVTGAVLRVALDLPWSEGLLFGALIASTDPVAVLALFKEVGAPRRLSLLVAGESLFNDGAAITLFAVILAAATSGRLDLGAGVGHFFLTVVGALVIGTVIGYGGSHLLRASDSAQVQLTATVLAAYGSYLIAETFTFSGAIAVVVVGLFFGNYGSSAGLTPRAVRALDSTWEFIGFVATSLVFLLIGIELDVPTLVRGWWPIVLAFLAALCGRAAVVFFVLPLLRGERAIPWRYLPVILWGGLRGAVSLALVLSLPLTLASGQPFPNRGLLLRLAFGVVGLSLLTQGLTMSPLLRWLGLSGAGTVESSDDREDALIRIEARVHAIEDLLTAYAHEDTRHSGLRQERLIRAYTLERDQLEEEINRLQAPAERDGDAQASTDAE